MMTVGTISNILCGFKDGQFGSLFPNPLPNGVFVTSCQVILKNIFTLDPSSIKSCTINNITINSGVGNEALGEYLRQNIGKTIPVIFHFD